MINKNSPYENDEIPFERNQFYGTNFDFFIVDSTNSIAKFNSGYYPIPKDVFRSKSEYLKVDTFMEKLPLICNSYLSPKYKGAAGYYSSYLLEAKKGLFSFEEQNNWTNIYDLFAIPSLELKVFDLPQEIRDFLNQFKIDNLRFREVKEINILEYFECDLTPEK